MAFVPASNGDHQGNLAIAKGNLEFSQRQLVKYQTYLENESDPTLAKQYQEEVDAYKADIVDYQEKIDGYTALIAQNPLTDAAPAVLTAETSPPGATPGVQVFEDGSTLQTFDDGSTLATATDGTVTSSPAPELPPATVESPTNPSATDAATTEQYKTAGVQMFDDGSSIQTFDDGSTLVTDSDGNVSSTDTDGNKTLPKGGVSSRSMQPAAQAQWPDANDVRAILKVPSSYINNITDPTRSLSAFGGIVFPYTPQVSFTHDATYSPVNPTHSNYTQYFYKNSAVSSISVNAKFTVQNETDAIILIGVITLLRALTKMKFGPDKDAGAPPPVCRFSAYGNFMMSNVPVTVASFKHELPDGVDYFQTGLQYRTHGLNFVPVMSVISLTLNPTYSRSEMMRAGVANAVAGKTQRSGFL